VFSGKAAIAGSTRKANSGAGTREPWHIPGHRTSVSMLMKSKHLLVWAMTTEQALHLGSISGDFFEAAVFGFDTKNQYQNDFDD